jgi:hypothetical protein
VKNRVLQLPAGPDDELLAILYTSMRELTSGKCLPRDVPVSDLTEEELIEFWADDLVAFPEHHVVRQFKF